MRWEPEIENARVVQRYRIMASSDLVVFASFNSFLPVFRACFFLHFLLDFQ